MAKKGSQLRRFKESLSSVARPGKPKRNHKQVSQKDPDRTEKLKRIEEQFNAFDTKFTRSKHEVFGRKVRGKVGKPGASKETGEQFRKKALLMERQRRNKVGGVIDRRFGENDTGMDPEEKILERFAREKQKRTRNSSLYNLEDDTQLTHLGQSLAEIDDFDEPGIGISDDDGEIKADVVRDSHFGGNFEQESESDDNGDSAQPKKTKAEVMQEIISKSKMYKYERQQQHEEDTKEIEELDADLGEIQGLLQTVKRTDQVRQTKTQDQILYDVMLREMQYDKRSKPATRIKTEEEIAQEEMEKLQRLEEERLERMRGEDMDIEEIAQNLLSRREGDDLDDDFVPDEGEETFYQLEEGGDDESVDQLSEGDGINEAAEDMDEDDDEFDGDLDIAEYFTDEEQNDADDNNFDEEETIIPATKRLRIGESTSTGNKLAFTFPCPSSFEELLDILKDVPTESIPIVIERIEILHSTKLLAENRKKLENFTPLVLKLMLHLAADDPVPFNVIRTIGIRLHGLASQFPSVLTSDIFSALETGRKRLTSSLHTDHIFPTSQELVLFYTIGQIYPTSDYSHPVVNPATLLMGQILGQMKIKTVQDLARGLFICSLFLKYQSLSKRIGPEVVNFLNFTLVTLVPVKIEGLPNTRSGDISAALQLKASDIPKEAPGKMSFLALYSKIQGENELKPQILNMALELVNIAADLWKSVTALPDLFQSTRSILELISKSKLESLPTQLQAHLKAVLDTLTRRIKLALGSRGALALQAHRPIPIPSYLPKFKESYSLDSKNDPDHQRASLSKLRAQHRREKKSVIRELRKEARTEAVVRSEEGKRKDEVYKEKMRLAMGIMRGGNDVGKWERDQKRKRR